MTKQERRMAQLTVKMHKSWVQFVDATMERNHGKEWTTNMPMAVYVGEIMDQASKYVAMCQFKVPCPSVATVVDAGAKRVFVWGNTFTPVARETRNARKAWVEVFDHLHGARKVLWRGLRTSYLQSLQFCVVLVTAVIKGVKSIPI